MKLDQLDYLFISLSLQWLYIRLALASMFFLVLLKLKEAEPTLVSKPYLETDSRMLSVQFGQKFKCW